MSPGICRGVCSDGWEGRSSSGHRGDAGGLGGLGIAVAVKGRPVGIGLVLDWLGVDGLGALRPGGNGRRWRLLLFLFRNLGYKNMKAYIIKISKINT